MLRGNRSLARGVHIPWWAGSLRVVEANLGVFGGRMPLRDVGVLVRILGKVDLEELAIDLSVVLSANTPLCSSILDSDEGKDCVGSGLISS